MINLTLELPKFVVRELEQICIDNDIKIDDLVSEMVQTGLNYNTEDFIEVVKGE